MLCLQVWQAVKCMFTAIVRLRLLTDASNVTTCLLCVA